MTQRLDALTPEERELVESNRAWLPNLIAIVDRLAGLTSQQTPEGWKLVPREPTPEMIKIGVGQDGADDDVSYAEEIYRAMYDAAPSPPAGGTQDKSGEKG